MNLRIAATLALYGFWLALANGIDDQVNDHTLFQTLILGFFLYGLPFLIAYHFIQEAAKTGRDQ